MVLPTTLTCKQATNGFTMHRHEKKGHSRSRLATYWHCGDRFESDDECHVKIVSTHLCVHKKRTNKLTIFQSDPSQLTVHLHYTLEHQDILEIELYSCRPSFVVTPTTRPFRRRTQHDYGKNQLCVYTFSCFTQVRTCIACDLGIVFLVIHSEQA